MGLDMQAYKTPRDIPDVDFPEVDEEANKLDVEIAYWRKHPNLHGWMEKLYYKKGGQYEYFNCCPVKITSEDLDELEKVVLANELPFTDGFFFGVSQPEHKAIDIKFIADARAALKEGLSVYYTSWW